MAFKRKSTKADTPEMAPTNAPVDKTDAEVTNEQTLNEIRKNLATATTTDLDQQPKPKSKPAATPTHEASLGQLSAQRLDAEQKVKHLVQELDRQTTLLHQRLDAEHVALQKVVAQLQANLKQATDRTTHGDLTAQQRDLKDYQSKLQANEALLRTYFNGQTFVRPLSFQGQTNYYILSPDLKADLADADSYALRRLKETFTKQQALLSIITTAYNADLKQIWQKYQDTGLVAPNAQLLNLYQDLQTSGQQPPVTKVQIPDQENWVHHYDGANETITDQQGHKIMLIQRRANKSLWLITYLFEEKPIKRDVFDSFGRLSATQMIDRTDSQFITNETFYRDNGSIVLIKDYDAQGHVQIQLLNEGNILTQIFTSEQDLVAWWLKTKVFQTASCVILSLTDPLLAQLSALHIPRLELWPLVTVSDLETPAFQALFAGQNTIQNILAAAPAVAEAIVAYANDIRVSTVIPTDATQQKYKVVLPKLY